jgi:hypothetical protein
MPEKDFIHWIPGGHIVAWRFTRRGVTERFRVALLAEIEGKTQCITRYDTAHGYAHRDILNRKGEVISKETMRETNFSLAFQTAIADLALNYERYIADYRAAQRHE